MRYVPFTKAKPLDADSLSGYIGYNCYGHGPQAGGTLEDVANVADVATLGFQTRDTFTACLAILDGPEVCPLEAYLRAMSGPEVLTLPGLPPSPYRVAPCAAWDAQGLHAAAWAAWWAAIARQRANRYPNARY